MHIHTDNHTVHRLQSLAAELKTDVESYVVITKHAVLSHLDNNFVAQCAGHRNTNCVFKMLNYRVK